MHAHVSVLIIQIQLVNIENKYETHFLNEGAK